MNPSDAVKALADCGAQTALAHHHGTFQLTDEAIDAPVIALGEALDEARIPRERFAALKPGQILEILIFSFDAFSSREPVSISLENASTPDQPCENLPDNAPGRNRA